MNSSIISRYKNENARINGYAFIRLVAVLCIALSWHSSFSQPVVIHLIDKENDSPVAYAYVTARQINGSGEDKQLSNSHGDVNIGLALPFVIHISVMGYRNLTDTLVNDQHLTVTLSPDFYQVDQVVVTGQFRPQPVDKSIYRIKVIDSRQIELKAANNLGDLLRTEPGFQLISDGVLGDFVRFKGLSGEYVKILIDGMPVTGRVFDRIDLAQISLQNVDHVEIIDGPMSVIYGSSALAGVINLITANYAEKKLLTSVNGYYETVGIYNFNASFTKQLKGHTLGLTAARNFFAGWGPDASSRYKIWKPKRQYLASASYQFQKKTFRLAANSDFINEEMRDPGALTLANLYEKALDGYHFTTRSNNRLNIRKTFAEDLSLDFQAGYSYYRTRKITYLNDLVNLRKTISEDPGLQDTTTFQMLTARGVFSNLSGKTFQYQTGFDMNYESALGKRTGGYREMSDMAGFLCLIIRPFDKLSLQPGMRFIHNSNFKAPLVYGLSLKYNNSNFQISGSYAKGFQAPTLKQLYLHFIDNNHEIFGNENLKSETADNVNLSFGYSITENKSAFGAEFGLFYNSIKDAIQLAVYTQKPGWGTYFNVEGTRFKTTGAQLDLHYRYSPCLTLTAGVISTGRMRLNAPGHYSWSTDYTSSLTYCFRVPGLQTVLFYKYCDSFLEFAGNYNEAGKLDGIAQQFTAGYHILDATITKNLLEGRINISTGFKNLFNVTMVNSLGSINPHGSSDGSASAGYGRTFFVKLGYVFKN